MTGYGRVSASSWRLVSQNAREVGVTNVCTSDKRISQVVLGVDQSVDAEDLPSVLTISFEGCIQPQTVYVNIV